METTKTCTECGLNKPVSDYTIRKTGPHVGELAQGCCKLCYAHRMATKRESVSYRPYHIPRVTTELASAFLVKHNKGLSTQTIANEHNVSDECVRKHLRKQGIQFQQTKPALVSKTPRVGQRRDNQRIVRERLMANGCMDCGNTNLVVLTFDHRVPADKSFNLSCHKHVSKKALLAEIAKCDVVCANCHFIRTAKMFGSWRLAFINDEETTIAPLRLDGTNPQLTRVVGVVHDAPPVCDLQRQMRSK